MTEPAAVEPGPRLDPVPVDPAWPDPAPGQPPQDQPTAETPARRPRAWRVTAVVLLAVVLVAVLAWRAGAFGIRTDRRWPVTPGTTVTAGPFELTFDSMTVQKKKRYDDTVYYEAKALGTGRTTADESLAPRSSKDDGMFVARDDATGTTAQPESLEIGESTEGGDTFTPGLPPTPVTLSFNFDATFQPQATLALAVIDQEFRDNSLLGDQDPEWRNAKHYFYYVFPVKRLPDDLS